MLLSFMYGSMYNYDWTLFAIFSSLFCFILGFVAGFPPNLFLDVSHLDCIVFGKIHNRMMQGAAVATFVRELLFVVPHDKQDIRPSRTEGVRD